MGDQEQTMMATEKEMHSLQLDLSLPQNVRSWHKARQIVMNYNSCIMYRFECLFLFLGLVSIFFVLYFVIRIAFYCPTSEDQLRSLVTHGQSLLLAGVVL